MVKITYKENEEGSVNEITIHGYGEPIKIFVLNKYDAIIACEKYFAVQLKKRNEFRKEIMNLRKEFSKNV